MKIRWIFSILVAVLLNGCGTITPISQLALPPMTTIQGRVMRVNENGFYLKDKSASVFVQAKLMDNKALAITSGESVTVCGNLRGGEEKVFDGYVIKKAGGEQIMVSRPSPHFGFIIQTAFE